MLNLCCPANNSTGCRIGGSAVVSWSSPDPLQNIVQWLTLEPTTVLDVTTYDDLTDNHLDGIAFNALPVQTDGVMCSQALLFSGNTWLELEPDPATSAFSVSIWAAISDDYKNRTIFDRGNFSLGYNFYSGVVATLTTATEVLEATSTSTYEQDTFLHIAASYDGQNLKLYVNGVLEDSVSVTEAIAARGEVSTVAGSLDIAQGQMTGALQDLRVHDIARSGAYFAAEYANVCGSLYTL